MTNLAGRAMWMAAALVLPPAPARGFARTSYL